MILEIIKQHFSFSLYYIFVQPQRQTPLTILSSGVHAMLTSLIENIYVHFELHTQLTKIIYLHPQLAAPRYCTLDMCDC